MAVDQQRTSGGELPGLRRNLKLWHVIGLSIGLMAPSMAISINPQGAIAAVGRAIPLSFTIALVGALLVAYGFSRLSQHFHHSGSVLGLVGATLGPRAGVVAAWCLAGTYILFALLTAVTAGIYGTLFLQAVGIIRGDPNWLAYLIGAVVAMVSGFLAAVLIKLLGHSGPGHLGFTMSVFTPAKGTTTSNVFLGVVFGFLSFGGFEAAAALGGEASRPRRDIPRAIVTTVIVIGVFYVVISAIEVMGFGTSKAGLDNFASSPALLGTLGQTYVAKWFGDLIIAGTVISAFGCSMASSVGASRLIYSFARDGASPNHVVARVSPRYGTPVVAVGVVVAVELVLEIALGGLAGAAPLTVFAWTGTISTLLILIAYGLVTVGAAVFLFVQPLVRGEPAKARIAEIVLPVAGVALLLYTIYRNVVPYPSGSAAWLPVAAGMWLLIALAAVAVAPSFSRRLGARLVTDEGFELGSSREAVRRRATA